MGWLYGTLTAECERVLPGVGALGGFARLLPRFFGRAILFFSVSKCVRCWHGWTHCGIVRLPIPRKHGAL